jgi:hypothetical protein
MRRIVARFQAEATGVAPLEGVQTGPGPTLPPVQWIHGGALSPRVKRPRHEAYSSPCIVQVKKEWSFYFHSSYAFIVHGSLRGHEINLFISM